VVTLPHTLSTPIVEEPSHRQTTSIVDAPPITLLSPAHIDTAIFWSEYIFPVDGSIANAPQVSLKVIVPNPERQKSTKYMAHSIPDPPQDPMHIPEESTSSQRTSSIHEKVEPLLQDP